MDAVLAGLQSALEPHVLLLLLAGVVIGLVVGTLPGLGGAVTLALMLPFTFDMTPVEAFAFLMGTFVVTQTAGDITSVLFGIPGEATAAATVLDGYPMTRRGEAGRALGTVLFSSVVGAIIGVAALAVSVPVIRPIVLAFGQPEFFALTCLGLTFIVALSGAHLLKGFLMAALGLAVAMVGLDPQAGVPRYDFGSLYLWDGISIVPLVVGLFGGAEVLQLMLSKASIASAARPGRMPGVLVGVRDTLRHWSVVVRASLIGVGVGIIPGMGGSVAQFAAYGHAQQSSKHPEEFGKGSVEGVIAAGAVNNSKDTGALIPTIAFGVPGSVGTALLLSAFLITGLDPGVEMLTTRLDVTFSIIWFAVLGNIIGVALCFAILRPIARLTFISGPLLVPFLLLLLTAGAFGVHNSMNDVLVMLGAAVIGVAAIRWDWPRVPFLLAVVLGPLLERYLFLSSNLYGWGWLTRPGVLAVGALVLLVLGNTIWRTARLRRGDPRRPASTSSAPADPPAPSAVGRDREGDGR